MKLHKHNFGPFFADKNMVEIVDEMAKRYGKTPSQICMGMTLNEFNFNVAVMFTAVQQERERMKAPKIDGDGFRGSSFPGVLKKQISTTTMTDKQKKEWEIIRKGNKDLRLKEAVT